jgi:opacity protein-like surface antigen
LNNLLISLLDHNPGAISPYKKNGGDPGDAPVFIDDPRLFNSQEDYDQAKEYKAEIDKLEALPPCEQGGHAMAPQTPSAGFYAGGALGERWTSTTWTATSQISLGGPDMLASPRADLSSDPIRGKVFAGYDWPVAPGWLLGAVGDVGFGSNSASRAGIPGSFGAGGIATAAAGLNDRINVSQGWDISLRARAGFYVMPNVLAYGTAGIDFLHSNYSINCTLAGACGAVGTPVAASASATRAGWVAGGGVQFGLQGLGLAPGWSGQVEYLHADFGGYNATLGNPATFRTIAGLRQTTDTVMVGLVYRFGRPPTR